ncbi:hypothetical protein LBMAG53_35340 [Planctomycetota bacterium]|nr:hypothetical protein LBMAG53_35340 [Planctomycetota bacterium]
MLGRTIDAIAKRLVINRDFHVPYLAGYSTDGRTIYIDRDLPRMLTTSSGRKIQTGRYLLMHEAVEKALIDTYGLKYQHAHQVALRTEKDLVRADGFAWREYDRLMQQYIKVVESKKPLDLPPDLDLKPYIDEHDGKLLAEMKRWMRSARRCAPPVVPAAS